MTSETPVSIATDQARLRWRCRRGLLELDLILQTVLDDLYDFLSTTDRAAFLELLELPDNQLLDYLQGRAEPPQENLKQLVIKILQHIDN